MNFCGIQYLISLKLGHLTFVRPSELLNSKEMFGAPDDGEEVEEPPAAGERGQGGVARLLRLLRLLGLVTVGLGPDQRQHQPAHTPPVQHPH